MVFVFYTSAIFFGLFALFQWLWRRRELYLLSWQLPGPLAWPLVGNFFNLLDHHGKLLFSNLTFF